MSTPSLQPGRTKTLSTNTCQSEFGGEFQSERCREELGDDDRKGYSLLPYIYISEAVSLLILFFVLGFPPCRYTPHRIALLAWTPMSIMGYRTQHHDSS